MDIKPEHAAKYQPVSIKRNKGYVVKYQASSCSNPKQKLVCDCGDDIFYELQLQWGRQGYFAVQCVACKSIYTFDKGEWLVISVN